MDKKFALVIKSSLWEGIFVDDKCVNCTNLEIVHAKQYFAQIICSALLEIRGPLIGFGIYLESLS